MFEITNNEPMGNLEVYYRKTIKATLNKTKQLLKNGYNVTITQEE